MTEPVTRTHPNEETDPLVLERIEQFRDMKFGLMLHWGIYSVWGAVESWPICAAEPYGRAELPAWEASGQDPDRFMRSYFDMGQWMRINHEAIYGTRPIWPYEQGNILLTQKGPTTYAILLCEPGQAGPPTQIPVPGPHSVKSVRMLGADQAVTWTATSQGVSLCLPERLCQSPPCPHAWTFALTGAEFQPA